MNLLNELFINKSIVQDRDSSLAYSPRVYRLTFIHGIFDDLWPFVVSVIALVEKAGLFPFGLVRLVVCSH